MIKRTVYLGNPAYVHVKLEQLHIKPPPAPDGTQPEGYQVPIQDLGLLVLDHPQITLTQALLMALMNANVAVITCDEKHHPAGQLLPLCGNVIQHERYQAQLEASVPLKKQLWAQVIEAKLLAQATALRHMELGETAPLIRWAGLVRSGDPENLEGRAAAYYWDKLLEPYNTTRQCRRRMAKRRL